MTAEITTVVGQLSISGGKWRSKAPNQVAVREPKSEDIPGVGKGDLFIVTEVYGNIANRDALEQQLAQAIRDTYYLSRGSITASLRRAVQAGSDLLYYRNQHAKTDKHAIGGAVVLATCHKEAFVAQIGPAAFFAVLGDHIRRYPAQSAWLDRAEGPTAEEETSALGQDTVIEPHLHHLRITPHDKLVLADSRFAGQLPLRDLVHAVDPGNVKVAVKNLAGVAKSKNCSAIVLEVVETKSANIGPLKISAPKIGTPSFGTSLQLSSLFQRRRSEPADETAVDTRPVEDSPLAEVSQTQPVPEPPAESHTHTSAVFTSTSIMQKPLQWLEAFNHKPEAKTHAAQSKKPDPVPHSDHVTTYQIPKDDNVMPDTTEHAKVMDSMAPESIYQPEAHEDTGIEETSVVKKIIRGLGMGLFMLMALLANGLRNIFRMLLPGTGDQQSARQAGTQAQRNAPSAASWKLLRNIAIAIPILVILIVTVSYLQKGRIREAEYNEFVTTAQQKFEQAQAVDTTAALGLMTEAEAALVKAEEINQDQPEIAELRQQMAEEADRIGNVHRLYYMPQLRQYADAGTSLNSIIVQGLDVYVMDAGNDRIFHHKLDDLGEALLPDDETTVMMTSRGQVIEDVTVSELLGITWMPTGGNRQTSDLVILNSTGLLEYNPNWGITTSTLGGGESLVRPTAVDSFFGNFYVLDPQANTLVRYLPTHDGYSLPPESYFPTDLPLNLTNAVDLTIDGAIYVLYQDGRIEKYLSGQLDTEFTVTGLDKPFNNPVSIFTAPDEEVQYIYVADADNQRIVQLNKDGSFVRQFKPRLGEAVSFANVQDLFVDEIGGRMYILDSNNLYLTNIPAEE